MKKLFIALAVLTAILAGAAYWLAGNLDQIVKQQVETQGSKILQVPVSLESVKIKLMDGLGELNGFSIANPKGYSNNAVMSFDTIRLDIDTDNLSKEHIIIEEVLIDSVSARYEMNAQAKGNMNALMDNLATQSQGSTSKEGTATEESASGADSNLKLSVKKITVKDTQLTLDLSALGQSVYDETLPTFSASNIGGSEGLPPAQLGTQIARVMLKNIGKQAEKKQKDKLKGKLMDKINEKTDGKLESMMEKFGHKF